MTKSLQQGVSQIKILSNKIPPRRMYVTNETNHLTKSLQQGVSQIKILSNKIPPRRMYVTDETNHLTKSLQQGVSQIKILSNKIPPRRMYVTDEAKHLAKSLQQGVNQTKLLKLPVSHHDECTLPTKENNWQKKIKRKKEQSASLWQSKHITDKEKTSQAFGKQKQRRIT